MKAKVMMVLVARVREDQHGQRQPGGSDVLQKAQGGVSKWVRRVKKISGSR